MAGSLLGVILISSAQGNLALVIRRRFRRRSGL
jgi:hypothetical protein